MQVSENPASTRMNYRPRMPRNRKENQASALIHCRAEFALFVKMNCLHFLLPSQRR
jgi:hypothetical protein